MSEHTPVTWEMGTKCEDHSSFFDCDINIWPKEEKGAGHQSFVPIAVVDASSEAGEANARLIAAAPEMLEALWTAMIAMGSVGANGDTSHPQRETWEKCQRAIAKAKGE
jgi:hypothetical protein